MAEKIDWEALAEALAPRYSHIGRGGKPIRMMAGALILKHMHNLSDEELAKCLSGDVYWMAFCGINEPFKTQDWQPLDESTMTNFRKRIGPSGVSLIDQMIREQILAEKRIDPKSQFVDTTAMEKNVAYPTDTDLLDKGRRRLIAELKKLKQPDRKISIGQTYQSGQESSAPNHQTRQG